MFFSSGRRGKTALWVVILAGLITTVLSGTVTGAGVPDAAAQTVVLINDESNTTTPIASVTLDLGGTTTTIPAGSPCTNVTNPGNDVIIDNVALPDGTILDFVNVATRVTNFNAAGPANPNNIEAWDNGNPVAWDDPAFRTTLTNSFSNANLQDHISYDGGGTAMSGGGDFDVLFQSPYSNDDYVVIAERDGNTFFNLVPLDVNGDPIPGANTLLFDDTYTFNTCLAPPSNAAQPWWFSVADANLFGLDTDVTPIYGFRVDNNGNADIKFMGLAEEAFTIIAPVLEVRKTVVTGGVANCPTSFADSAAGLDTIPVVAGDTVTYCFWVANTGDGPAADVVVTDAGLGYTSPTTAILGAGAEVNAGSIDEIVDADTPNPNLATVNGTDPADPTADLTSTDPAGLVPGVPALEIRKTVVAGGAASCPTSFADSLDGPDTISVVAGNTVTYCFWVANTGDGPATDVVVTDAALGFTSSTIATFDGQDTAFAGSIDEVVDADTPNPNLAGVTGTDPLNPATPLADTDESALTVGTPGLEVRKTVVAGGAASCPTSFADSLDGPDTILVAIGDTVTYCFWVANTGDGPATDVVVIDAGIGYTSATLASLAGQDEFQFAAADVVVSATTPNPNTAAVDGVDPVDPNNDLGDADTAALEIALPALEIRKTVVAGGAANCPTSFADSLDGPDTIPVVAGDTVTYCFWVANTGEGPATDVVVTDAGLVYTSPPIADLAGQTSAFAGSISETVDVDTPNPNTATVTGTDPATPGGPPLTDTDTSALTIGVPVLEIRKTVVPGPGGTCPGTFLDAADGLDVLSIAPGDTVTYCFWVANTGDGPATDVLVTDPGLAYSSPAIATLAAGDSALAGQVDEVVDAGTPNPNTSTVAGTDPADPNNDLGDSDDAGISAPVLEIRKTVLVGAGATCPASFAEAADGLDTITIAFGGTVTYCFWVANTGLTEAANVTVTDAGLGYSAPVIATLAAGESVLAGQVDEVVDADTPNPNTATVTGVDPADPAGPGLNDADDSAITLGVPALEIRKTVVPGPGGTCPATFATAADGLDTISVVPGDTVTYCFWVANTGTGPATTVAVTDSGLSYVATIIPTLAAGDSVLAGQVDEVVDADTPNPNTATVSGLDPGDPTGPGLSDTDNAGISAPVLEIRKTVVAGPGGTCPATFADAVDGLDTLAGAPGDTVTYCFWVANTGLTEATSVAVTDGGLGYAATVVPTLAGGDSVLAGQVDEVVDAGTPNPNTATVTGVDPADLGNVLVDSDDSAVSAPVLEIRKTVLVGAGATCPATFTDAIDGQDIIDTTIGETVTYCFWVANTGLTEAANVTVTDAGLGYSAPVIATLAAGDSVLAGQVDEVVDADTPNPNTATVTGVDPADPAGPGLSDSDDSGLNLGSAALEIRKTVVPGPGGTCPATFATAVDGLDILTVAPGDEVTYCFWVANTGTGPATTVAVTDAGLGYSAPIIATLAAGDSALAGEVDEVVDADTPNPNTATVSGLDPGDPTGPGLSDTDNAGISAPVLEIRKTVVAGPGGTCPATFADAVDGLDTLAGAPGDTVTYCFWVANTGLTEATSVAVTDGGLGYAATVVPTLAGGDSVLAGQVDEVVDADTPNPNTATAVGVDPADLGNVLVDSDDSAVSAPVLEIRKTVLVGAGATCPATFTDAIDGQDIIDTTIGETVTYCFWVANTGLTEAANVTVTDAGLGYSAPVIATLAAGDSVLAGQVDEVVDADTPNPNTATVTGVDPADPAGPGLSDADDSAITLGVPALEIRKTVVPGPGGTCPATFNAAADGLDTISVVPGDTVTYCFWVANTGTGPATTVAVTDAGLSYVATIIPTLAAGDSALAGQVDEVVDADTPNPNTATVTGLDPGDPTGPGLSDTDNAGISAPVLEIRKTVVPGPAGTCPATFADAADGLDTIGSAFGDTVTYCFWVANTGLTDAIDVIVEDTGLGYTASVISTLGAGAAQLAGQVDEAIDADTPNPNTATASAADPEDPNNALGDSDTSGITGPVLEIRKTVVAGSGATCPAAFADAVDGLDEIDVAAGDTVTYCFWVANTGLTEATNVTVTDAGLGYSAPVIPTLAAADTQLAGQVDEVVDADTPNPNTATVAGTDPADPVNDLTDSDDSGLIPGVPVLEIRKTVVSGPGGTCPATFDAASDGLDTLGTAIGNTVTYCLWVANIGDGPATSVEATDTGLGYAAPVIASLAGGDSQLAGQVDEIVDADTPNPNTATVTGIDPLDPNGPGLTDSDDSGLALGVPFLEIRKTVVAGPSGTCPATFVEAADGTDHLITAIGDTVTYCFWVSNVGVGPATNVVIDDSTAGFTSTPISLAAGASADAGSIDVDVTSSTAPLNTATVTGTDPGDPNGPGLTDSDTSSISGPVLEIRKTVLAGAGATCPATFADAIDGEDTVPTSIGETVTYCFWVANTGFTDAANVTVTDTGLGYSAPVIPTLASGANQLAGQIDEVVDADTPNPNTAQVTGADPADPNAPELTDSDDSGLSVGVPILEIRKTVVAGPGGVCPASFGDAIDGEDTISTEVGSTVTYCFWVANMGQGPADDVVVSDNGLVYVAPPITRLAAGAEQLAGQVDEVVDADTPNPNTATVVAVDPADPTGPVGPNLMDEDLSSLEIGVPVLEVRKTVVAGPGGVCPATFGDAVDGDDSIETAIGETVTYCFWVANSGDGPATNVVVTDGQLGFAADPIATLAAGTSLLAGQVDEVVDAATPNPNTATVVGVDPADPDGPELSDSDDSSLNLGGPVLEVRKTVVVGPGGVCPATFGDAVDGDDSIDTAIGETVTYCFWVANSGDGPATNVAVTDGQLGFAADPIATLAAGTSLLAGQVDEVVDAATPNPNTATVVGVDPADPDGPELSDSDDSSLTGPALELRKTVVAGPGGTCPATFAAAADGDDSIDAAVGDTVTYCFWVTNSGISPATDVVVTDGPLGFAADPIATLAAGASLLAGQVDEVVDAATPNPNTATVTGSDPSDPDGPELTDEDDSSLNLGGPVLEIRKTVVLGPEGICPASFDAALDGLDVLVVPAGAAVSYCLWIANTGTGPAVNVVVEDAELGFTSDIIDTLAPGGEVLAGLVDAAVNDNTPNPNTATVTGTDPADPNGPEVSDSDQSGLDIGAPVLEIRKTIVAGPGGSCPETFADASDGLDSIDVSLGDTVTYCLWASNSGAGAATDVVINDPALGFTSPVIATMEPGDAVLAGQIDEVVDADTPNPNVASVSGIDPADLDRDLGDSDESGIVLLGSISDKVFADMNGNGIQDPGDPGVGGVVVNLLDADGSVLSTTTTAADGSYIFDDLPTGTYVVQFVPPAGQTITTSSQGSDSGADSDADPNTQLTDEIELAPGENRNDIDAGIIPAPIVRPPQSPEVPQPEYPGPFDPPASPPVTLPSRPEQPLAYTGSTPLRFATIAYALVLLGGFLVVGARRREDDDVVPMR